MRKYYIDNLRFLSVLLLFPFHTCMIYNNFGENFYIKGQGIRILNDIILLTSPWFMPLMFVIAGISSAYALRKRTEKEYLKERVTKLFIPLCFGILIYIPAQTYFAERFHNGYLGGYLEQYRLFFTKPTDLTGYTGGFTPGHLWFILYLLIIILLAHAIVWVFPKMHHRLLSISFNMPLILLLFLIPMGLYPLLNIGGKSIGEYLGLFLLGFYVLSRDELQERLDTLRWWLTAGSLLLLFAFYVLIYITGYADLLYDVFIFPVKWFCILAILGLGKHYLNFNNRVTAYLSKASFPVYYFHQTWLIITAFYVFQITSHPGYQVSLIMIFSIFFTFFNYELFRRVPVTRFMFGIKKL